MPVPRAEIRDHHPGPKVQGADDGIGISQSVLPGAPGVQPAANRPGQALEQQRQLSR
jgi:hypothetical protein